MKYLMIVSLIHLIKGNILEEDKCPEVEPMKNFSANKISGMWYMIEHYPNDFDSHYKCIKESFTLADDDVILIHYIVIKKTNNEIANGNATLAIVGDPTVANFILTSAKTTPKEVGVPIIILDTDYENYLIFWVCLEKDDLSARLAWVFSRTTTPNQEILDRAKAPFVKDHLNPEYMEIVEHENCNY